MEFSKVYGRIDRIVTTKEEGGGKQGVGKGCRLDAACEDRATRKSGPQCGPASCPRCSAGT